MAEQNLSVADVLDKAADLLSRPGAWTQGDFARDETGQEWSELEEPVPFSEFPANCFCLFGAIASVVGKDPDAYKECDKLLIRVTPGAEYIYDVSDWNDQPERTQGEVVAKLREAAALARAESQPA